MASTEELTRRIEDLEKRVKLLEDKAYIAFKRELVGFEKPGARIIEAIGKPLSDDVTIPIVEVTDE